MAMPLKKPVTRNKPHWMSAMPIETLHHQDIELMGGVKVAMMHQAAFEGQVPPTSMNFHGMNQDSMPDMLAALKKYIGKVGLSYTSFPGIGVRNSNATFVLCSRDTYVYATYDLSDGEMSLYVITRDQDTLDGACRFANDHLRQQDAEEGPVHMLVSSQEGVSIVQAGVAGKSLQPENYDLDVLDGYAHVKEMIVSPYPDGRLSIFSGPPGSGKTHLIRDMIKQAGAKFLLLPANMIGSASAPELLPALSQFHRTSNQPLVLILEDGDSALVQRGSDNMSAVSSLLNLGDGILGSILDVRIVLTTNAKKLDMDKAALRDGRLCRHVVVGEMSAERATSLLRKLVGDDGAAYKAPRVLASVYADARGLGWKPAADEGKSDKSKSSPNRHVRGRLGDLFV